jgi:protein phosphatase
MGTTVVASAFRPEDGTMAVVHAGDSRAYHIRNGEMVQLTRDHSLLSDALLERPELTEADLAYLPKNVITRALGIGPTVDLDATYVEAEPGDYFILCSDGLHGLIDDDLIADIVNTCASLTECCAKLVGAANQAGGRDNITAVVIRIDEEAEPWSVRSPGSKLPPASGSAPPASGSAPPASGSAPPASGG